MDNKNQDSRYLLMWTCVIVAGAIIFAGWLWVIRHNINRTNAELSQGVGSMEQMTNEMQKMFNEMSDELKKTEVSVEKTAPPVVTPAPASKPESPTVNADKK